MSLISRTSLNVEYLHYAKVLEVYDNALLVLENGEKYYINHESTYIFNKGDEIYFEGYYSKPDDLGFYVYLRALGTEYSLYAKDTVQILDPSSGGFNYLRNQTYSYVMTEDN
jgi:hypothetical protein